MTDSIPLRAQDALTGRQFIELIRDTMGDIRGISPAELDRRRAQVEELVYREVTHGNVPDFMRPENFREITVETQIAGRTISAKVRVCPDYLAIGNNDDFFRVPLSPITARRIADRFGFVLPTQRLTDVIDTEARSVGGFLPFNDAPEIARRVTNPRTGHSVFDGEQGKPWNLAAYGYYEGIWMLTPAFAIKQNEMINSDLVRAGSPPFRSGMKKEVLYDPLAFVESHEGGPPVVIYRQGIQGLSNWHNETYHDYSHGIRFLSSDVHLTITERDGSRHEQTMSMRDALMHPEYHRLFAPTTMDIDRMYRRPTMVPRRTDQHTLVEPTVQSVQRHGELQRLT